MKWYQLSSTKVIEQTKTKQTGLSSEERQQRYKRMVQIKLKKNNN